MSLVDFILFRPPSPSYKTDSFNELIWIPTDQPNYFVPALLITRASAKKMLLYLHGNSEDLGQIYEILNDYADGWDVNILAVEYPGYGLCVGTPSEQSLNLHARVGLSFLIEHLQIPPEEVIIFGRSIGTGPAIELTASLQERNISIAALLLQSPFLSVKSILRNFVGGVAKLIDNRFNNERRIKLLSCPVLFLHGNRDTLIPLRHSEALFNHCPSEKKELSVQEDATHNTWNKFADVINPASNFLDEHVKIERPELYEKLVGSRAKYQLEQRVPKRKSMFSKFGSTISSPKNHSSRLASVSSVDMKTSLDNHHLTSV